MSESFDSWAIVELMGHVRIAGRVSEVEVFGGKMGRIDVPVGADAWATQFFTGQSVYRITPCGEVEARAVAAANQPRPVHPWESRLLEERSPEPAFYDEDEVD